MNLDQIEDFDNREFRVDLDESVNASEVLNDGSSLDMGCVESLLDALGIVVYSAGCFSSF